MERFQQRITFSKAMTFEQNAHAELVDILWNEPDRLIEVGDKLIRKQCVRTTVRIAAEEETFVIKRHLERSWRHQVKQWFCRSRAERCWRDTWHLIDNGYPTPTPIAYREERFGFLRGSSFYVYKFVEGDTLRNIATGLKNQRLLRRFVLQLVDVWRLHLQLGVNLSDAHPDNFVLDPTGKMWVIDLDKLQYAKNRVKHIEMLEASFMKTLQGVFGDESVIRYGQRKIAELIGQPVASLRAA